MTTTVEQDRDRGLVTETETASTDAVTGVSDGDLIESFRRTRGRETDPAAGPEADTSPESADKLGFASLLSSITKGLGSLGGSLWGFLSDLVEEKAPAEGRPSTYNHYRRRQEDDTRPLVAMAESERPSLTAAPERSNTIFTATEDVDQDLEDKRKWHMSEALNELAEAERLENEREDKERKIATMLSVEKEALGITSPQVLAAKIKEISARAQEYALETGDDMRSEAASLEAVQEIVRRWQLLEDKLASAGFDVTPDPSKDRREQAPGGTVTASTPSAEIPSTAEPAATVTHSARETGSPVDERRERPTIASLDRMMTDLERTADELLATRSG